MKTIIKKIISSVAACFISVTMLFNLSVSAALAPAAPVAIPILQEVLMGIGAVLVSAGILQQSDISGVSNTELQETVTHAMERPENLDKLREAIGDRANNPDIESKINSLANSTVGNPINPASNLYNPFINLVASWINSHYDNVKTEIVDDGSINMRGYGAALYRPDVGGHKYEITYMEYGTLVPYSDYYNCQTYGASLQVICSYSDTITERPRSGDFSTKYTSKIILYGDWRYADGTPATDIAVPVGGTEQALPIGSVIIDGVEYPVTPDGVQIGDNVYPISKDGTIIIEGDTYKPTYNISNFDDSSIVDLLLDISNKLDTLSFPAEDESVDNLVNNAVISIPDDLSKLNLKTGIASVFPFCIPFDFVRGLKLLAVKPEAPRFEVPFTLPAFGSFPGVYESIVIDFEEYSKYFDVVRWGFYVIFLFGLCFITFKIVKGA